MSFDSTFDYTGSITFINNRTDTINVEISTITTKLADLANVDSAFDYLVNPEITTLNNTKNIYDNVVTNLQSLKGEIQIVTDLSSADKANLYSFYIASVGESKKQWMARLVYNTTGLVENVGNVLVGNLSTIESNLMAQLVCQKFPITGTVHQIIHKF